MTIHDRNVQVLKLRSFVQLVYFFVQNLNARLFQLNIILSIILRKSILFHRSLRLFGPSGDSVFPL